MLGNALVYGYGYVCVSVFLLSLRGGIEKRDRLVLGFGFWLGVGSVVCCRYHTM